VNILRAILVTLVAVGTALAVGIALMILAAYQGWYR
jgi:hypothetical protein